MNDSVKLRREHLILTLVFSHFLLAILIASIFLTFFVHIGFCLLGAVCFMLLILSSACTSVYIDELILVSKEEGQVAKIETSDLSNKILSLKKKQGIEANTQVEKVETTEVEAETDLDSW